MVLAQTVIDHTQDGDETYSYDVVNVSNATEDELGNLPGTIVFENARVLPVPETPEDLVDKIGVGIHKQDAETSQPLAGAVYELYTVDAIYDVNGNKLADAGDLLATSTPTDDTGFTWFDVDVPIRGEAYADGETEPADGVWNASYCCGRGSNPKSSPPKRLVYKSDCLYYQIMQPAIAEGCKSKRHRKKHANKTYNYQNGKSKPKRRNRMTKPKPKTNQKPNTSTAPEARH